MNQDVQNSSKALAQRLNNIAKNSLVDNTKLLDDRKNLLDALLRVRDFVQGIKEALDTDVIKINTTFDDLNGWPGFQVFAYYLNNEVGKLVVGAQERRTGPIMFFRNTYLDKSIDLSHFQYENVDELHRTMKRVFREFADEIENAIVVGNKIGSFDKSEEEELTQLDLSSQRDGLTKTETRHDAHNAGVYLHSDTEDLNTSSEDDGLSSLDLFS